MKNKRIAFYIGSLNRGGAERVITNLAEYFYGCGYQVWMITKFRANEEYPVSNGINRVIADLTKEEEKGRICNFFNRTLKLRRIIKDINPDIVVSFIGKSNLRTIAATRGTGIPAVVSVRSNPEREIGRGWKRLLTFLLFGMVEGVVVQTTEAKAFFPRYIQRKTVILQNSLNPEFIRPAYRGERQKEIVSVGRIDTNKNQKMLIEAFAKISEEFPEWKVVLYGDGIVRKDLENNVSELGLSDRIIFKGVQHKIASQIERASVFVLSSKQEGMPNALIEAMSLGLAVISTDCPCGGPRDLIDSGKNGILIPVDNTDALAEALKYLLKNKEMRELLGRNALLIKDNLKPDKINGEWESFLQSVARK